jgi:single-stranded DNA-binding protein
MGGDGSALVSIVAFGSAAERLLSLSKGAAVAASGRAELKSWTAKDGTGRTGLSIVASEIAAARPKPRTRDGAPRQRSAYRRPGARPAAPQFDRADLPRLNDPIDDLWPARAS